MKEKVYFDDSKGNKVCGILNDPLDDKNIPMVILCHGFSSTKDSPSYDIFQNAFNKRNISIFKIDFYGHGESDGEFADITLSLGVDDALSAIKYLKKQGYTKICLVGTSFGGAVGLIAATKCKDLFCLALKCPVSDYYGSYLTKKTPEQLRTWQEKGYLSMILWMVKK